MDGDHRIRKFRRIFGEAEIGKDTKCATFMCRRKTILGSPFCFMCILHDPLQRLYRQCAVAGCVHPVPVYSEPPLCTACRETFSLIDQI